MNDHALGTFATFCLIGFLIMLVVSKNQKNDLIALKKQAVELKHAEYNVKTGEWQWITNR